MHRCGIDNKPLTRGRVRKTKVNLMYIYDRRLSGANFVLKDPHLSGDIKAGAREVTKQSATNQGVPKWLQDGVRQGRWTKQTASGLWALRKISHG